MTDTPLNTHNSLPEIELDTQGLYCPEPVMLLHKTIRKAAGGQSIRILASDPATCRDIPNFCSHLGHTLVQQPQSNTDTPLVFVLQKRMD